MFAGPRRFLDGVLRNDTAIVFDRDFELVVRQNALAELEDLRQPAGGQPMIRVAADVGLENDGFASPDDAAAIDEALYDVTDFGDVSMGRDLVAAGKNKTRKRIGIVFKDSAELG